MSEMFTFLNFSNSTKAILLLFCFALLNTSFAQTEKRLALVIGNSNYEKGELKNPVNDALLMASTLESLDFDVILDTNIVDKANFIRTIRQFGDKRSDYDVAIVYYAGHGIQVGSENFLLPTKSNFENEYDVIDYGVSVQNIMRYLTGITNQVNILVLDACRDNPFEGNWTKTRSLKGQGLAKIPPPTGSIIAFSTDAGNTAADGKDNNSIYCESLCKNMLLENTSLDQVFRNVRMEVLKKTDGDQRPVESSQLTGSTYYLKTPNIEEIYKKIDNFILNDNLDSALFLTDYLIVNNSKNSLAYTKRGHINFLKENYDAAEANYQKAINIEPLSYGAYFTQILPPSGGIEEVGLSPIYGDIQSDTKKSIGLLEKLKKLDPNNPITYQEIARDKNWGLNQSDDALKILKYAVNEIPYESFEFYKKHHYLFYEDYNLSIMASLLVNISYVLDTKKDYKNLIKYAKEAIDYELKESKKSKNIGWMYNTISDAYYYLEEYEEALLNINLALKYMEKESRFFYNKHYINIALGNYDLALIDINNAIKYDGIASAISSLHYYLEERGDLYKIYFSDNLRALLDYTETLRLIGISKSFTESEKNIHLIEMYICRGELFRELENLSLMCEDFRKAYELGNCESYNSYCK